jgi:SecD/SecF fusion protein
MAYIIFLAALAFFVCLVWYLSSPDPRSRRIAGLAAIITSLATCLLSIFPLQEKIHLGLDLKGGASFLVELQGNPSPSAVEQAISVIRKRMDSFGTRELMIQPVGSNRIDVQVPGLSQSERAQATLQLSKVAKLEFKLVHPENGRLIAELPNTGGKLPVDIALEYEVIPLVEQDDNGKETRKQIVVKREAEMSGKHVTQAYCTGDQLGRPEVLLFFDNEGQRQFGEVTGANIGHQLAIVLDGEARSAPVINDRITNQASITGKYTLQSATELASILENPLDTPVQIKEVRDQDPSLGLDSIQSGRNAGLIAFLGVVLYMVVYYRIAGVISVIALVVNLILLLGLMAQFHFTLTLPGIAGIVLTIGMAVDANVLIYERIRDELAISHSMRTAIELGFDRAFSAIFDSNITTLIPAAVLMILGTGSLRGFAITLGLGIIANLFAALVVSHNLFDWLLASGRLQNLTMMQFLRNPNFNFLRYSWLGVTLSIVILVAGFFSFRQQGDEMLGVDFTGGEAVTLRYQQAVPLGEIRTTLERNGIIVNALQYSHDSTVLQMQTKLGKGLEAEKILETKFPQARFSYGSLVSVGPQVGQELRQRALLALSLGLLGILIYAALRFEWSFAVAAAIGQLHDVLIALSFMAFLKSELTLPLVAAFLTIAGYSINDKVVVFDRIREGRKLREKGTFYETINRALNLTLARTLLTGGSCIIATFALIIFGGPVIHDFSVAMLIGILSGIYSSHFISPVIAWWIDSYKDENRRAGRAVKKVAVAAT